MPKQFEIESVQPWIEQFAAFEKILNGESKSPLHAVRNDALGILASTGFPTAKHEEWRNTPLGPLLKTAFARPARDTAVSADEIRDLRASFPVAAELVFVNGRFNASLSRFTKQLDGVIVTDLATAMKDHRDLVLAHLGKDLKLDADPFAALNTAFVEDGAFIYVPKGKMIEEPVHAMFLHANEGASPVAVYPRLLVVAEAGTSLRVVESYQNVRGAEYFTNAVVEIYAGDNAQVEHYTIQLESEESFHVSQTNAVLGRDTRFWTRAFTFGGRLVRNNIEAGLHGEGGECTVNGLFMPRGKQHIDNHTVIDHAVPHCNSFETYKGLLDGESRGVFSGKIIVRPDAQKTDAKQSNNNILLSDTAHIDTTPRLEIFADDVRCTHGATIGRLDEKAMFYLRSRGLDKQEAFNVLSFAFASDLVQGVTIGGLRSWLDEFIHERLRQANH